MTISLAACGGSESETSANTGGGSTETNTETAPGLRTVTLGMNTSISTLDPWNGSSTGTIYLQEALHDTLYHAESLGAEIQSVIGKSYEVTDDGKTITVEIYDYVHDQAGNKIDASDVAWSYNTFLATGNATQFTKYLENAEAVDDTHVVFHMKEAKCQETSAATSVLTGCVIYDQEAYNADAFATNPMGC